MLIDQIKDKRVLVVGDVMLDHFVWGSVERVSPEAPALVLNMTHETEMIGGAGNVAANVVSLGGRAILCGVIGNDTAGDKVAAAIRNSDGRLIDALVRLPDRPTTLKSRYIAGDRHLLRADREVIGLTVDEEVVLARAVSAVEGADAIIVSDYLKGVVTGRVMDAVRDLSKRLGIPLVVDPKRRDFRIYAGATILTPNIKEIQTATGIMDTSEKALASAAEKCMEITGSAILLTKSEKGVSLFTGKDPVWSDPARARRVRDVSGAGDTVTAALALGLAAKLDMPTAARLANTASSLAVEKSGTSCVTAEELNVRLLHAEDDTVLEDKLATQANASRIREDWRLNGLKVGFTNGCFDLIHPGHVRLLKEARKTCDKLVVAINSDASVSRLKGPTRPVQTEAARAVVIGALEAVDLVVVFDEDTPLELIKLLSPDVLIKGADYTVETVVGSDVVIERGGEVRLIDLVEGQSTTKLIAKSRPNQADKPAA